MIKNGLLNGKADIYSIHVLADGQLVGPEVSGGLLINHGKVWVEHASFGGGRTYRDHFANGFVEHPEGVYWLATDRGLRRTESTCCSVNTDRWR